VTRPSATRLLPTAYRPLFDRPGFRRLLPALLASDLGDGMSLVAVVWLALDLAPPGRRGLLVGWAVAAYALPGALGALVFSRRLRQLSARRLLTADATLRGLTLACVPAVWSIGLLGPITYVALLAGASLLHAWGGAGKYALVAQLLPPGERPAANALLSAGGAAALVLGPALAGLLVTAVGPAWLIGLDALTFGYLALRARGAAGGTDEERWMPRPGRGRAVALLRHTPQLAGALGLTWFFNALYGPVEVALPLHVTDDLHADAGLLGMYWAVFGAGAVLGGLAVGALRRLPVWPAVLTIVAGWGAALLCVADVHSAPLSLAWFTVGGLLYGPFGPLTMTLHQRLLPPDGLASVLALRRAVLLTAAPVGTALGGPLTAAFGPRPVLAASGGVTLAVAAVGWVLLTVLHSRGLRR
jgi:predicted MFS family arabinose efflux permease